MSKGALRPRRHAGEYAFVVLPGDAGFAALAGLDVVATVREADGTTAVLPASQAAARGLSPRFVCAWITLELETGLDEVQQTMRDAQVRRLPVVEASRRLLGIVSLVDVAKEATRERRAKRRREITESSVCETLAAVSRPPGGSA